MGKITVRVWATFDYEFSEANGLLGSGDTYQDLKDCAKSYLFSSCRHVPDVIKCEVLAGEGRNEAT